MFLGQFLQLVVVDPLIFVPDTVMGDFKETPGEIGLVAVGQMAAVGQVHRQHFVAGLKDGKIDGHVGLAAGVGLDVDMLGAEDAFGALNGQALDDVHIFATAVPAFAGIAFGVFIGQDRALGFHDGRADKVLAGDQFDVFLLALALQKDGIGDVRID